MKESHLLHGQAHNDRVNNASGSLNLQTYSRNDNLNVISDFFFGNCLQIKNNSEPYVTDKTLQETRDGKWYVTI